MRSRTSSNTATSLGPKRRSKGRGVGEAGGAPDRGRELGVDPDPRGDLGERPALAVRAQAADRGEAHQTALFLGLHELGDRRADLVGEIRQQREPLGRVVGASGS